jgi:sigma-B regulation protein RsbU (phosphoserine phosphatase)
LSIRSKLFIGICLPIVAIYLTVLSIEYRIRSNEAIVSMEAYLKELTESEAAEIDTKLSSVAQVCLISAEIFGQHHSSDTIENISILRNMVSGNCDIFGMATAYEPGVVFKDRNFFSPYFCRDGDTGNLKFVDAGLRDFDYTSQNWYMLPKEAGKPVWTDPYYDNEFGKIIMCTYSAPIFRNGSFIGVSAADISLLKLSDDVDEMKAIGGYCVIVSRSGRIISHPVKSYIMHETIFSLAEKNRNHEFEYAGKKMTAGESGIARYLDFETGKTKWIVFSPVKSAGWSFAAVIFEDTVMQPIYSHIKRSIAFLLSALAVIAVIIFYISSRIIRPLGMLADAVEELGRGNLKAKVIGLENTDETGVLARAFNKMVVELGENVQSRIREEAARKTVEAEINVAREIQLNLLPRKFPPFPDKREFELHALNRPAKFIAGDFFDFFFMDDDTLSFVIADVSGKGISAAMFMAVARTMLRDKSLPSEAPASIMKKVSDLLSRENDKLMFLTIFYGHYDIRTGELRYVNAGHNPPYLIRKNGEMEELEPTGPLAAVFPDAKYAERTVCLEPCDMLVCFTDGVTEAYADGGELFGDGRFVKLLSGIFSEPVEEICSLISDEVLKYSAGELKDDVTLLVLRRRHFCP